ncbi:uncharacterized protein LOC113496722 [Trichoplusia ni]|uniref:Uncharacterized protein LOC113496722 n=1 Tax=Trichoplusia ni TaxID=7111 RepID=A0A7E5VU21_TRINI|nr:uncharacterized protein LOC113496722 [Trichoplusia ni]
MKVVCIIVALSALCQIQSLDYRLCQETPKEKHCLIEYSVRYRWPHELRYVYNWHTKSCFEIRWSAHCEAVTSPANNNNFPTERECLDECGGWS